jgi:hypothetical protein
MDFLPRDTLSLQIEIAVFRGSKQQIGELVSDEPVYLLRHGPVEGTEPCFYVSDQHSKLGAYQSSRCISQLLPRLGPPSCIKPSLAGRNSVIPVPLCDIHNLLPEEGWKLPIIVWMVVTGMPVWRQLAAFPEIPGAFLG